MRSIIHLLKVVIAASYIILGMYCFNWDRTPIYFNFSNWLVLSGCLGIVSSIDVHFKNSWHFTTILDLLWYGIGNYLFWFTTNYEPIVTILSYAVMAVGYLKLILYGFTLYHFQGKDPLYLNENVI